MIASCLNSIAIMRNLPGCCNARLLEMSFDQKCSGALHTVVFTNNPAPLSIGLLLLCIQNSSFSTCGLHSLHAPQYVGSLLFPFVSSVRCSRVSIRREQTTRMGRRKGIRSGHIMPIPRLRFLVDSCSSTQSDPLTLHTLSAPVC